MLKGAEVTQFLAPGAAIRPDLPWRARAWMLQGSAECELGAGACAAEVHEILALLVGLCACLAVVFFLLSSLRDDRDEQIVPLCPQMIVTVPDLKFKLPLTSVPAESLEVLYADGSPAGRVLLEPKVTDGGGVAARGRLQDEREKTLVTVAAPCSSGLSLFRGPSSEIFGTVEPGGRGEYHVRHRTGVHLLTICGDFDEWDVVGTNFAGAKVFSFRKIGEECIGSVIQQVDAGLVIASLIAIHLHRLLQSSGMRTPSPSPRKSLLFGAPALEEGTVLSPLRGEDD